MHNLTFVCFACRTTERDSVVRIARKCRKCRRPAEHVYYKFRIPAARDDRGWEELMQKVRTFNRDARARTLRWLEERRDRYERILQGLNAKQDRARRALQARIRKIRDEAAQWELT